MITLWQILREYYAIYPIVGMIICAAVMGSLYDGEETPGTVVAQFLSAPWLMWFLHWMNNA